MSLFTCSETSLKIWNFIDSTDVAMFHFQVSSKVLQSVQFCGKYFKDSHFQKRINNLEIYIVHLCCTRSWREKKDLNFRNFIQKKKKSLKKISLNVCIRNNNKFLNSKQRTRLRVPPPRSLSHCLLGPFLEPFPTNGPRVQGGWLETVVRDPRETRNKMERGGGRRARDDRAMIKDNFRSKIKDYSRGPRGPSTNQSPRKYKMHEARIPRGRPSRDVPPPLCVFPSSLLFHTLYKGVASYAHVPTRKNEYCTSTITINYVFCCIFHIVLCNLWICVLIVWWKYWGLC